MVERSTWPSEEEVYAARRELHDLELNVAFVGRVQNYDPASQTATIIPLMKEQIPREDGLYDQEDLPPVPHVAILQPRTRGWGLSIPVQDGDTVLCVCLDGDPTSWRRGRTSEGTHITRDLRRHHLAHAVAIAGFYRYNEPLRYGADRTDDETRLMLGGLVADGDMRMTFRADGSLVVTKGDAVRLRIDADGMVHLGGAPAATKPLAVAELVDALAQSLKDHIAAWVPVPTDGGASLKAHIAAWTPPSVAAIKVRGV